MEAKIRPASRTGPFKCLRCGSITASGLKYCTQCGEKLTIECPGCNTTWRFYSYYPYCPECGTKTSQRYAEAAR